MDISLIHATFRIGRLRANRTGIILGPHSTILMPTIIATSLH